MTIFEAAGHTFQDGRCACGRKWVDIMQIDMSYVGEKGWDHAGSVLNARECQSVIDRVALEKDLFSQATQSVASGGGYGIPSDEAGMYDESEPENISDLTVVNTDVGSVEW